MLANQFFTLPPKCLGGFGIECVGANAFAVTSQRLVLRHDLADVTILAVASPDLFGRGNKAGPDRRGCSLRDRLVLERRSSLCRGLPVDSIDRRLQLSRVEMPTQFGLDAPRMTGGGSNPAAAMARVESNCKKDVGCLRAAVGNPRVVRSALEVGVSEIDVGEAVSRRCEINQPSAWSKK